MPIINSYATNYVKCWKPCNQDGPLTTLTAEWASTATLAFSNTLTGVRTGPLGSSLMNGNILACPFPLASVFPSCPHFQQVSAPLYSIIHSC